MEKQPLRIKSLPMKAEGRLIEPGAYFPVGEYHPVLIIAETPTGYWGIPGVQDASELEIAENRTAKFYVDVRPARTTTEYTITGSTKDTTKVTGKFITSAGVETTVAVDSSGRSVRITTSTTEVKESTSINSSSSLTMHRATAYLLYRLLGHSLGEAPINIKK